jgi:hypothetical protein
MAKFISATSDPHNLPLLRSILIVSSNLLLLLGLPSTAFEEVSPSKFCIYLSSHTSYTPHPW